MAIFVTYRYVCDFCGDPCRDDQRVQYVPDLPLHPAEVPNLFGQPICPECLEMVKKVLANRAKAVSDTDNLSDKLHK